MKRQLLRSNAFVRSARRVVRRQPDIAQDIESVLEQLSEDAFDASLKTHRLKGKLDGSWACSVGLNLRIIFSFKQYEDSEAILLEIIGTHEEVY